MSVLHRLGIMLLILFSVAACRPQLPITRAAELEKKICACTTTTCTKWILDEFEAFQSDFSGFEDAKVVKGHLAAALSCAQKVDPEIKDRLVKHLKARR